MLCAFVFFTAHAKNIEGTPQGHGSYNYQERNFILYTILKFQMLSSPLDMILTNVINGHLLGMYLFNRRQGHSQIGTEGANYQRLC